MQTNLKPEDKRFRRLYFKYNKIKDADVAHQVVAECIGVINRNKLKREFLAPQIEMNLLSSYSFRKYIVDFNLWPYVSGLIEETIVAILGKDYNFVRRRRRMFG